MRVLITGGSGFIGTNLVARYLADGHDVVNLDMSPPRCADHYPVWRHVDLRRRTPLTRVVEDFDPELVLHFGARTDLGGRTLDDYDANTIGTRNLIDILSQSPRPPTTILASSMLVCRLGYSPQSDTDYCPVNPYGESKVAMERDIREIDTSTLPWTIVRPTSIWGPWFDVPYKNFFDAVTRGIYLHPLGHSIRRHYGFVGNTVHEVVRIANAPKDERLGKTFYLADYPELDIKKWADMIQKASGAPKVRSVPVPLLKALASGGDLLKKAGLRNPPLTSFRLSNLMTEMVFDLGSLPKVAGALPYSLERGVELTVDWIKTGTQDVL